MKKAGLIILVLFSFKAQAQNNCNCVAFSKGCWTLIGASNGVEHYVTHKKVARPNFATKGFDIIVYSKIVNTTEFVMQTGMGTTTTFYYYDIVKKLMAPKVIEVEKILAPKQTIVQYLAVFTNSPDISYTHIKSFIYTQ